MMSIPDRGFAFGFGSWSRSPGKGLEASQETRRASPRSFPRRLNENLPGGLSRSSEGHRESPGRGQGQTQESEPGTRPMVQVWEPDRGGSKVVIQQKGKKHPTPTPYRGWSLGRNTTSETHPLGFKTGNWRTHKCALISLQSH